ncbi:HPP family protein [Peptococcus simiae]|uniref:CBS domain-containing protein n=1 Tax=Peptococcus simiae TaxID=1643805 RepID=UPI00398153FF
MAVLVKDVMIENPKTLINTANVGDAIQIFAREKISSIFIVDKTGELVGILSDADIIDDVVHNVRKKNKQLNHIRSWYQVDCFPYYLKTVVNDPIDSCYTSRVYTVRPDDTMREASKIINKRQLRHMPVVDEDNKPVGLITRNNVVHGLFKEFLDNPNAECLEDSQDDDF